MTDTQVNLSPLGKKIAYADQYDRTLLFPIARKQKRIEIGILGELPFHGYDTWNAFEISWLDSLGKPVVAIARFDISSDSKNIIESKSFKIYLNSFNNTVFTSIHQITSILKRDIQEAAEGDVDVVVRDVDDCYTESLKKFDGESIDNQAISIDTYTVNSDFLTSNKEKRVSETLYSNLLKSNCLVTGQPDWGSVQILYAGSEIDKAGLLRYIVSFRNHNEFHEQCVERIFVDIMTKCQPEKLTVHARYTRRGGLDINPIRSTEKIPPAGNIRMARQ